LIRSEYFSTRFGAEICLKLETTQRTGFFKPCGEENKIAMLIEECELKPGGAGVVAASPGNHALVVELAASLQSLYAIIVMPEVSSISKPSATSV